MFGMLLGIEDFYEAERKNWQQLPISSRSPLGNLPSC